MKQEQSISKISFRNIVLHCYFWSCQFATAKRIEGVAQGFPVRSRVSSWCPSFICLGIWKHQANSLSGWSSWLPCKELLGDRIIACRNGDHQVSCSLKLMWVTGGTRSHSWPSVFVFLFFFREYRTGLKFLLFDIIFTHYLTRKETLQSTGHCSQYWKQEQGDIICQTSNFQSLAFQQQLFCSYSIIHQTQWG
jgi:hypothetical protein